MAVIEPADRSVLDVGQVVSLHFRLYDQVNERDVSDFGDVTWSNENPTVVRLVSPVEGCGSRCAVITALAPGVAQLRAVAPYQRGIVETAAGFGVR